MKTWVFLAIALTLAVPCFGQEPLKLCPRHIEQQVYPPLARTAHLVGKISVAMTIDAEGEVIYAKAVTDGQDPFDTGIRVLNSASERNALRWTFEKPPRAPYEQTIVFEYKMDTTRHGFVTDVTFDFPDHVTLVGEGPGMQMDSVPTKPK